MIFAFVLFTPLLHFVAQLADIKTKVSKRRDDLNALLSRRDSAEEAYRHEANKRGITPEQVDADIKKACQSPQSNKLLMDIHKLHMEAEKAEEAMNEMEQKRQQVSQAEQELNNKVLDLINQHQQRAEEVH